MHQIGEQIDRVESVSRNYNAVQHESLGRIEEYSRASMYGSLESMSSLQSIAGSLSRLETMVSTPATSPMPSMTGSMEKMTQRAGLTSRSRRLSVGSPRKLLPSHDTIPLCKLPKMQLGNNVGHRARFTTNPDGRNLWSCVQIVGRYEGAFCPSGHCGHNKLPERERHAFSGICNICQLDLCCYCGATFTNYPDPDWSARTSHLIDAHNFGECDEVFFSNVEAFRLHLKNDHAAFYGRWSTTLENACMPDKQLGPATGMHSTETHQLDNHLQEFECFAPELYPSPLAEYISLSRIAMLLERHELLMDHRTDPAEVKGYHGPSQSIIQQHLTYDGRLDRLRTDLKAFRKRSLLAGHRVHDIDRALLPLGHRAQISHDSETPATNAIALHHDTLEIQKHTRNTCLLQGWSTTRDRVNRWLLHNLRSDNSLARVHRSMLAEQNIGSKDWSQLVLTYWYVDDAARGAELRPTLSSGAVHSYDESGLESTDFYTCATQQNDRTERVTEASDCGRPSSSESERSLNQGERCLTQQCNSRSSILDDFLSECIENVANNEEGSTTTDSELDDHDRTTADSRADLGHRAVPIAIPFPTRKSRPPF